MKELLVKLAKPLGLLPLADNLRAHLKAYKGRKNNQAFLSSHPNFIPPPVDLAFDAYGHVDWQTYHDSGLDHAALFASLIRQHHSKPSLKVLDWGCGPARLIRHMPILLGELHPEIFGVDYNPRTIVWCKQAFPELHFAKNQLKPPLPFESASFDVIYGLSVFTHLSENSHLEWMKELKRVLKPQGLLILSTYGEQARGLLTEEEKMRFDQGHLIVRPRVHEGKRGFAAFHSPSFVQNHLLRGMNVVDHLPAGQGGIAHQDVWAARNLHR